MYIISKLQIIYTVKEMGFFIFIFLIAQGQNYKLY